LERLQSGGPGDDSWWVHHAEFLAWQTDSDSKLRAALSWTYSERSRMHSDWGELQERLNATTSTRDSLALAL
jgi:hypothetical protein